MVDRKELARERNAAFLIILDTLKEEHGISNGKVTEKLGIKRNRLSAMKMGRTSATLEELNLLKNTFASFLGEDNQDNSPQYVSKEEFDLLKSQVDNLQLLVSELSKKIE